MDDYKNILWIEDDDSNNRKAQVNLDYLDDEEEDLKNYNAIDPTLIPKYFGEYSDGVDWIKNYRDGLEKLNKSCYDYDLIVFDLDFNSDKDIDLNLDEVLENLKNGGVIPSDINREKNEFKKVAGYYLYLYLALKGFPTTRMVILTGNYKNYVGSDQTCPDISISNIISKSDGSSWINNYYSKEKSHYYRIRKLVYQACKYWKNKLEDNSFEIPFNKIYYSKSGGIRNSRFIDMLDLVQLFFPILSPQTQQQENRLYFKVMQTLTAFHEESAKISSLRRDKQQLKEYHACSRNFRNWSSHNHLRQELTADEFALLFCITLRTYFNWNTDEELSDGLLPYEIKYGFDLGPIIIDAQNLKKALLEIWEDVHKKLQNNYYSDLEEAIREFGKIESTDTINKYLFIPLLCPKNLIKMDILKLIDQTINIPFLVNEAEIEKICNDIKDNKTASCDIVFKRFCYRWIVND